MITDTTLMVSNGQALTATAGSTDVIDIGHTQPVGPGQPLYLVVVAKTALGGTTPTLTVSMQTDDNGAFSSATALVTSEAFTPATLTAAGNMIVLAVPYKNEQFLRAHYTLAGTSPTVTVDAYFTGIPPKSWKAMPAVTGL